MLDKKNKYWFYIYPYIYKTRKGDKILLYNTQNGLHLQSENPIFLNLIDEVEKKTNLGVTYLCAEYLKDTDCYRLIQQAISLKIAGVKRITDEAKKPIVLVPILNLLSDIEKMEGDNTSLIGYKLLTYLTEINIYINNECNQGCLYCKSYHKQSKFCTSDEKQSILGPDIIKSLLEQAKYTSLSRINILGGNIFLYSDWIKLRQVLKKYDCEFHFWIHYKNLGDEKNTLTGINSNDKLDILINFPLDEEVLSNLICQHNNDHTLFHFIVENEMHYNLINTLTDKYELKNSKIVPHFTGENYMFFQNNIFIEEEDIFSEHIIQRQIFCNQKLNSNNFGILNIMPNGDVKSNINEGVLGNIYNDLLSKIIYEELTKNTAWRKIRNDKPCNNCLYQFLCPPISNYELAIGKPNLCHINP